MSKAHRLKTRKSVASTKALPLNFLLGCSQNVLQDFQLARLAEVNDLRKELHAILDRIIDVTGAAALAQWFLENDRNALKHAIENEETPEEWAKRMIRDGQRNESELLPRPSLAPGAAHLAASKRYAERNLAAGLCRVCPKPLARNSVEYCEEHLAKARHRAARKAGVKGEPGSADYLYGEITESTHGRAPGNLARLAMNREKKTRAILAELGIPPESAAVSLNAAKEALFKHMPTSRADAKDAQTLWQAATVPSQQTGSLALRALVAEGKIQRIGKGIKGNPFRYFLRGEDAKSQ